MSFPVDAFSVARLPRIEFGPGVLRRLPEVAAEFGQRVLVVTGARSLRASPRWAPLMAELSSRVAWVEDMRVEGEPSPELVDGAVATWRHKRIDVVIGIGGGSALDTAKAIAGLLPHGNSVMDHLEGVGRGVSYRGPAVPFIAVPTTAGTGSEATKNAVIGIQAPEGFKKSFRDEALVARVALVDPDLLATCPPEVIAANGMDAFTQLLESYVSAKASAFTDALAYSGMQAVRDGLFPAWRGGEGDEAAHGRARMAYGALVSGITLAQAGLGSVHGLASPLGAFFPIPHGVVCGTLVATATATNIRALRERQPRHRALDRYAEVGRLLFAPASHDPETARAELVRGLRDWTRALNLPPLGRYGIEATHIGKIVAQARGSSMKTNPIELTDDEIGAIVRECL